MRDRAHEWGPDSEHVWPNAAMLAALSVIDASRSLVRAFIEHETIKDVRDAYRGEHGMTCRLCNVFRADLLSLDHAPACAIRMLLA